MPLSFGAGALVFMRFFNEINRDYLPEIICKYSKNGVTKTGLQWLEVRFFM